MIDTITACIICNSPLGQESKDARHVLCHEHQKCVFCTESLSAREIRIIVSQARAHNDEISSDLIAHDSCSLRELAKQQSNGSGRSLKLETELDLLNRFRLALHPDSSLPIDSNCNQAKLFLPKLIIHMSLEEKFIFMRMLQTASAEMSILLSKDKGKIQKELEDKHKKDFEEVQKIRSKSQEPKPGVSNTYGYSQKVWDNMSKTEKKKVKDCERAILALISAGLTRTDAETSINKHKR